MPTLSEVLVKNTIPFAMIESKLPAVAPKISTILADIATKVPVNPALPEIPLMPGGAPPTLPAQVQAVIQGIPEAPALPVGVPGLPTMPNMPPIPVGAASPVSASLGGYRPTPSPSLSVGRLSGGYRSIS